MIRLQPDWIGELVGICAADDWNDAQMPLDYPGVSPMFRRLMPELAETDEVTGYSSAEVRACKMGLEFLAREHPIEYMALTWEFQPWQRRQVPLLDDHEALVLRAGELLAAFVDEMCGG